MVTHKNPFECPIYPHLSHVLIKIAYAKILRKKEKQRKRRKPARNQFSGSKVTKRHLEPECRWRKRREVEQNGIFLYSVHQESQKEIVLKASAIQKQRRRGQELTNIEVERFLRRDSFVNFQHAYEKSRQKKKQRPKQEFDKLFW